MQQKLRAKSHKAYCYYPEMGCDSQYDSHLIVLIWKNFFFKTRCRNSVNLFKMRVRKLEENIKSYPRGNFFLLSSWTIFFFVLNGIFWQERLSKCAFVCVNGHKRECGSMLFAQRERDGRQIPLRFTPMFADYLSCVDVAAWLLSL